MAETYVYQKLNNEVWNRNCAVPRAEALEDTTYRNKGIRISFSV